MLDREFRMGLLADPSDWYQKIAARLGTRVLVSADKNYRKLETLDPELRLDAVVLYKDPLLATAAHWGHKGGPEAPSNGTRRLQLPGAMGALLRALSRPFPDQGQEDRGLVGAVERGSRT